MSKEQDYECMLIFDSNKFSRDPNAASKAVEEQIKLLGGDVLVSRLWAEQKLAYPIKKQSKGTYWLIFFRSNTQAITELNRQFRLNETILRHLITGVDERLIDALVAHALGKVATSEDAEGGETSTSEADSTVEDAEGAPAS